MRAGPLVLLDPYWKVRDSVIIEPWLCGRALLSWPILGPGGQCYQAVPGPWQYKPKRETWEVGETGELLRYFDKDITNK